MSNLTFATFLGANLPNEWGYHGCWTDYGRRKLSGMSYVDSKNMTQENCIAFCHDNIYAYAGIEYGEECYCGHVIGASSELKSDTECDFKCPGAADENCGAGYRLSVFYNGLYDIVVTNPGPAGTDHIGCLTDNVNARALAIFQASEDDMTVAHCTSSCRTAGYKFAGLEYGRQCFCGDTMDNNATMTDEGCDMVCAGNDMEFCGGAERLNIYAVDVPINYTSGPRPMPIPSCNPFANTTLNLHVVNGGFEQGLANWSTVAYDPDAAPFDIGLTNATTEGCNALTAVPRPGSKAQSAHFQASTTLIDLQPSQNYTAKISIGHPRLAEQSAAWLDPKFSIRISNSMVSYGTVCGFSGDACPYGGLNNSTYMVLKMPFQAHSPIEDLTVYLSWYNGNFNIPLYLDNVSVKLSPDDTSGEVRCSDPRCEDAELDPATVSPESTLVSH